MQCLQCIFGGLPKSRALQRPCVHKLCVRCMSQVSGTRCTVCVGEFSSLAHYKDITYIPLCMWRLRHYRDTAFMYYVWEEELSSLAHYKSCTVLLRCRSQVSLVQYKNIVSMYCVWGEILQIWATPLYHTHVKLWVPALPQALKVRHFQFTWAWMSLTPIGHTGGLRCLKAFHCLCN